MTPAALAAVADALAAADAAGAPLAPITSWVAGFSVADAYRVLAELERRRAARGWRRVGRKIGFTNRTLWPRYGVFQPMWAHVWDATVQDAVGGRASVSLAGLVEPRLEPEVVFGLAGPVPASDDPERVLASVAWIAPGFEIKTPTKHVEAAIRVISGRGFNSPRLHWQNSRVFGPGSFFCSRRRR